MTSVNLHKSAQFALKSDDNNYFRLVQWSPDGSCFISSSNDCKLRLFDLPYNVSADTASAVEPDATEIDQTDTKCSGNNTNDLKSLKESLVIKHSDPLYDLTWYPHMSSSNPATCVFAISSANCSIHLYDAYTGSIRGTYKSIDHLEQMHSAHSVCFTPFGDKLYAGFRKGILRIFDTNSPGCDCDVISANPNGGILSCIAFNSFPSDRCAIGSFNKNICLVDPLDNSVTSILQGQRSGVTHLKFSTDGNVLYSGARKDSEILAWDLRNLGTVLTSYQRTCDTNQTIYFDLKDDLLYSGNTDGFVSVWRASINNKEPAQSAQPIMRNQVHQDCLNGLSLHPSLPLMVTCSGQRHSLDLTEDDADTDDILFKRKSLTHDCNFITLFGLSIE